MELQVMLLMLALVYGELLERVRGWKEGQLAVSQIVMVYLEMPQEVGLGVFQFLDWQCPHYRKWECRYWKNPSPSNKLSVSGNADFSGNVGIGTLSPINKLSVNGNADFSGNVGVGNNSPTNKLSVSGNSDFTGNVGIGTSIPDQKLTIISNGVGISQQNNTGSVKIGFFVNDNGAYTQRIEVCNLPVRGLSFWKFVFIKESSFSL